MGIAFAPALTPEPAPAALLWLGLGGLAIMGRDRSRVRRA